MGAIVLIFLPIGGLYMCFCPSRQTDIFFALLFGVLSFLEIFANWVIVIEAYVKGHRSSLLPFFGGVNGMVAMILSRVEGLLCWIWLPLVLDPLILAFVRLAIVMVSRRLLGVLRHYSLPLVVDCGLMKYLINIFVAWENVYWFSHLQHLLGCEDLSPEMHECGVAELYFNELEENVCCVGRHARISVQNIDVLDAAKEFDNPMILNFANAHIPGGGYWMGACAQEETICRRSTLMISISSFSALSYYCKNLFRFGKSLIEDASLIYSPYVYVIRDSCNQLLSKPYRVSIASCAAPNRHGIAAFLNHATVDNMFCIKIRSVFRLALLMRHRHVVLGAWGCGAFGNNPIDVARCFRRVLIEDCLLEKFDDIVFAIPNAESKNFAAFKSVFTNVCGC